MKELSIEEKAKAYDEALKIARQYWNDRTMPIGTNFKLEKMFPELKESEDERMRKKCIELIKELETFCMRDGQKECIAWLENQGEKTSDKTLIEKACKWIKDNIKNYTITDIDDKYIGIDGLFIKDFRKAMEE